MHATSHIFSTDYQPGVAAGILKRFTQVVIFLVLQGAILFTSAGDLIWTWAWIFLGISLASVFVNGAILLRVNPETIAERGHARFTRKWDKIISAIYSLFLFLIVPLVAGLDIRHSWSGGIEIAWHVVGAIGFTGGLALGGWAMIVNAYFSTAVRIQTDRGQTVCRAV